MRPLSGFVRVYMRLFFGSEYVVLAKLYAQNAENSHPPPVLGFRV